MQANKQQIIDLETRFWESIKAKDAEAGKAMVAKESLVTGQMGASRIDPEKYAKLTREGDWTLDKFEFSDTEVIFPTDDVGVIAYKVHQTGTLKGKPMDMTCVDSTTWVREGDAWKAALHTETILEGAPQPELA